MDQIRLHDVVKRFGGGSGEDVAVWLRQLRLAARLRKIDDLATVIPLFLDGAAFAVYEQLCKGEQEDADRIADALLAAFGVDAFQAYEEFQTRTRLPGELVDVFFVRVAPAGWAGRLLRQRRPAAFRVHRGVAAGSINAVARYARRPHDGAE